MIRFQCDECGSTLKVEDRLAGKKGKCPKCNAVTMIPDPSSTTPGRGESSIFDTDPFSSDAGNAAPARSAELTCPQSLYHCE